MKKETPKKEDAPTIKRRDANNGVFLWSLQDFLGAFYRITSVAASDTSSALAVDFLKAFRWKCFLWHPYFWLVRRGIVIADISFCEGAFA